MKPVPPQLDIDDVGISLKELSKEELAAMPYDLYKWHCCVEGCTRFSRVKSFGDFKQILFRKEIIDLHHNVLYCHRHWKKHRAGYTPKQKPGSGVDHCTLIKSFDPSTKPLG